MKTKIKAQMKKLGNQFKKLNKKTLVIIGVVLIVIAGIGIYLYQLNDADREYDKYTEITFITPTQAIVFWRTETETLGYIEYGENKYGRDTVELQTSSEPGLIHVAFIDNIPPEGVYVSLHEENENPLVFPRIQFIKYDGIEDGNTEE